MTDTWADGDAYERLMGRWSRLLAPRLVAWARVPPGGRALDVGSGTGSLARALLDAGAREVVGVDASDGFVRAAIARVADKRATFEVGDAQKLRFADGAFDVAASALVLNFVPDAAAAAREMRRVTRRGGVVAACVWDYGEGMQMLRHFWDAVLAVDPEGAAKDEATRFSLRREGALARLFRDAGLGSVEEGEVEIETRFADFEDYWQPFLGGQGPAGTLVRALREPQRARLKEELHRRVRAERDGSIRLKAVAWAARGVA